MKKNEYTVIDEIGWPVLAMILACITVAVVCVYLVWTL